MKSIPAEAARMTFSWEWVTPEIAARWLETNTVNRRLRKHRVDRYSRDLESSRWRVHHQGVAFDTEGNLIDGQHRLQAIVNTKKECLLLVVRNCPIESRLHVDEIMTRSTSDALAVSGFTNGESLSNRAISIMKIVELLPVSISYNYSREDEVELGLRFGDVARFASQSMVKGTTRGTRTAIARAKLLSGASLLPEGSESRLDELIVILRTGMPVSSNAQEDSAAITMRNMIVNYQHSTGAEWEKDKYRKSQSCIHNFLNRVPMSKVYGTSDDLFPLPESFLPTIAKLVSQ